MDLHPDHSVDDHGPRTPRWPMACKRFPPSVHEWAKRYVHGLRRFRLVPGGGRKIGVWIRHHGEWLLSLWAIGCGCPIRPFGESTDDHETPHPDRCPRLATDVADRRIVRRELYRYRGRVVLGQKTGDAGRDEQPIHVVRLDGFCMDRTEMTDDSGSSVRIFADWASARDACLARGGRLPTEAEFEKAARGGCELGNDRAYCDEEDMRIYPWGNGRPSCELANHSVVSPRGPQRCSDGPTEVDLLCLVPALAM